MYLGHSFLAFALVVAVGIRLELDRRRILLLGGLAAGYGLLPDVDVWRTVYIFLRAGPEGVFPTEQYVWQHSWVVHRALTHSIVTGAGAAVASGIAVVALDRRATPTGAVAVAGVALATVGLLSVGYRSAGTAGAVTVGLFLGGSLALAAVGFRRGGSAPGVAAVAAVGLLTHPFGDFWMGRPPAVFAPLVADPPFDEVAISSDPVIHFLGAVGVEVALLWTCLVLLCRLFDRRTIEVLSPLALVGLGYGAVLGRIPHPTFAEAYQFAAGLFLLASIVALLAGCHGRSDRRVRYRAFGTGVAAFGLGLVSYAVAYAVAT